METQRTPAEDQRIHFEAIGTLLLEVAKYEQAIPKLKDDFNHKPFAEMLDSSLRVMQAQAEVIKPLIDSKTILSDQQMHFIREAASAIRTCCENIDNGIRLMTQRRNSRVINIGGLNT